MDRIRELEGRIRHYDWGSRQALAALQGRPRPTPAPEAELWFGAHPVAPSRVRDDSGWVPLPDWIARDPAACLGSAVAGRFAGQLPFLVKLLAVERPLSVQVHPDAARARQGFARESRAGIPLDDPQRCYRDPRHKPELVCALERFTALHGFRTLEEIAGNLAALGLANRLPSLPALQRVPEPEAWRSVFRELLAIDRESRRGVLGRAADPAGLPGCDAPTGRWVRRLVQAFPDDVGALAPLFLNLVVLEPGQALCVPPGRLHCYLQGVALEVMANSDNVLRGGLTAKRVDRDELLLATNFEPSACRPSTPEQVSQAEAVYSACADEFQLSVLQLRAGAGFTRESTPGVEVLVCVEGRARLEDPRPGGAVELAAGAAAFVPAAAGRYRLEGAGRVYRVAVPPCAT